VESVPIKQIGARNDNRAVAHCIEFLAVILLQMKHYYILLNAIGETISFSCKKAYHKRVAHYHRTDFPDSNSIYNVLLKCKLKCCWKYSFIKTPHHSLCLVSTDTCHDEILTFDFVIAVMFSAPMY
jgi:hypothetical protein